MRSIWGKAVSVLISAAMVLSGFLSVVPVQKAYAAEAEPKAYGAVTLDGTNPAAGKFTLQLQCLSSTLTTTPVDMTAENAADGSVTFDLSQIDFSSLSPFKTATFEMTEKAGSDSNIEYSSQKYYVMVAVNDNGGKDVFYYSDKDLQNQIDMVWVNFANKTKTPVKQEVKASAMKILWDLNGNILPLTGHEFQFKLHYERGTLATAPADMTVKNAADTGMVTFDLSNIDYTTQNAAEKPIAVFRMTEIPGNEPDIFYSSAVYYVVVGEGNDGKLAVTYFNDLDAAGPEVSADAVVFNNTRMQLALSASGAVKLMDVSGLNELNVTDGQFRFKLSYENGNLANSPADIYAENKADGSLTFDLTGIDYTTQSSGNYLFALFKMSEEKGTDTDIVYSNQVYDVAIVENDVHMQTVIFSTTDENGTQSQLDRSAVKFVNAKKPAAYGIKVLKDTDGNRQTLTDGEFQFVLSYERGTLLNKPLDITAENRADGSVVFDLSGIDFTTVDPTQGSSGVGPLSVFKMTETAGKDENITYSDQAYYVTVGLNSAGGFAVTYFKNLDANGPENQIDQSAVEFDNTIDKVVVATPSDLVVTKEWKGSTPLSYADFKLYMVFKNGDDRKLIDTRRAQASKNAGTNWSVSWTAEEVATLTNKAMATQSNASESDADESGVLDDGIVVNNVNSSVLANLKGYYVEEAVPDGWSAVYTTEKKINNGKMTFIYKYVNTAVSTGEETGDGGSSGGSSSGTTPKPIAKSATASAGTTTTTTDKAGDDASLYGLNPDGTPAGDIGFGSGMPKTGEQNNFSFLIFLLLALFSCVTFVAVKKK